MTEIPEEEQIPEEQVPEEQQGDPSDQGQTSAERHVDARAIVFPDLRILYVPVPKAGCTAVLWTLAKVAGLDEERFYGSFHRGQVSRSLTIHDLSGWPNDFLYAKLSQENKDAILADPSWLRFTVVRHPLRRLWSAWQSKILLSEPQFIKRFSTQPWFPRSVDSAADILKMFRQFLEALEEDRELVSADPHWAPQVDVTSLRDLPYTHVGRVEKLGETVEQVRAHLRSFDGPGFPDLPRENVTPLPYVDELFTESDARTLGELFADDLREFDYEIPSIEALQAPCPPSWTEAVDAVIPAVQALRDRNERVGDLESVFKEKRDSLHERVGQLRDRLHQQQKRSEDQKRRIKQQANLRAEEQRRNERLQKRLRNATNELGSIKESTSWRYTAPLRGLARLTRKVVGRRPN